MAGQREEQRTRAAKIILICALAYVVAYLVDSSLGGYYMRPVIDASTRRPGVSGGLGLPLAIQWQPRIGFYNNYEKTFCGYAFLPLIHLDRLLWHKTRYVDELDFFIWAEKRRELHQIHPRSYEELQAGHR